MANVDGLLEAVDCHIHSDRYDMELHVCFRSVHIGMNFTYDAVATLIRRNRARVVTNKLLYNHSLILWANQKLLIASLAILDTVLEYGA
eukprot:scaffold8007_cov78-Skeletonema_marinoi.AAC.2